MSATTAAEPRATTRASAPPRAGWTVVAGKEFGDHLRSARFYVLLFLLGLVGVATSYVAAEAIRGSPSVRPMSIRSSSSHSSSSADDPIPPLSR